MKYKLNEHIRIDVCTDSADFNNAFQLAKIKAFSKFDVTEFGAANNIIDWKRNTHSIMIKFIEWKIQISMISSTSIFTFEIWAE